jgi:hypothetical protein
MATLAAFTQGEAQGARVLLATQVASMMGRKLEEGDWSKVYCRAKGIPEAAWSNLNIDVNHGGLGLELKLLRIAGLGSKSLKAVCGTEQMHPAATQSIRIGSTDAPADDVVEEVLRQYADLINRRTTTVRDAAPGVAPDMRTGWLIWESSLTEFLYFEEPMAIPDPAFYYGLWNVTPARGSRKASKSLWVYDKNTNKKRYSVTTSAGIKIQPYFDIPAPLDPNLYHFRVQSEPVDAETVQIWVSAATARALKRCLGSLERDVVSAAVLGALGQIPSSAAAVPVDEELAQPVTISAEAHRLMLLTWADAKGDEHRAQLLLRFFE